jgi:membrane glycosyltransferase
MDSLTAVPVAPAAADERDAPGALLPAEQPLFMPTQRLDLGARAPTRPDADLYDRRRLILFAATAAMVVSGVGGSLKMLNHSGLSLLEQVSFLVFLPLFAGICLWFCSAVAGFLHLTFAQDDLGLDEHTPIDRPATRTALLAPVYNEDAEAVSKRLAAMDRALAAYAANERFDIYILSDSNRPEVFEAEAAMAARLAETSACRVFYRRRVKNHERKAGNVGDWVRRFGAAYESMIILDADSVMSAEALLRLVGTMERRPEIGLIQTVPDIVHGETLFARQLQFSVRLYGRIAAAGLAWWSGSEASYWGHNAIVRVRAFAEAAGLPPLQGPRALRGHIMSHDVVEAALMRRAGWAVHIAPRLEGSYEEGPPSLPDSEKRDRRWCQGNMQHLLVIPAVGLHWVSRLQLIIGCLAFFASPLWLLFLTIGIALQPDPSQYDQAATVWRAVTPKPDPAIGLLILTIMMLAGPKLLGWLTVMFRPEELRRYGGPLRFTAGVALEVALSALMAPIVMMTHVRALWEVARAKDAGWKVQNRTASALPWRAAWDRYGWMSGVGVAGAFLMAGDTGGLVFMSPILLGLVGAPAFAVLTARPISARNTRRFGLLVTPEEGSAPEVLRLARAA